MGKYKLLPKWALYVFLLVGVHSARGSFFDLNPEVNQVDTGLGGGLDAGIDASGSLSKHIDLEKDKGGKIITFPPPQPAPTTTTTPPPPPPPPPPTYPPPPPPHYPPPPNRPHPPPPYRPPPPHGRPCKRGADGQPIPGDVHNATNPDQQHQPQARAVPDQHQQGVFNATNATHPDQQQQLHVRSVPAEQQDAIVNPTSNATHIDEQHKLHARSIPEGQVGAFAVNASNATHPDQQHQLHARAAPEHQQQQPLPTAHNATTEDPHNLQFRSGPDSASTDSAHNASTQDAAAQHNLHARSLPAQHPNLTAGSEVNRTARVPPGGMMGGGGMGMSGQGGMMGGGGMGMPGQGGMMGGGGMGMPGHGGMMHMRDTKGQAQPGAPNATADKEIDDRSVPGFGAASSSNLTNATSQHDAAAQHNLHTRSLFSQQPNLTAGSEINRTARVPPGGMMGGGGMGMPGQGGMMGGGGMGMPGHGGMMGGGGMGMPGQGGMMGGGGMGMPGQGGMMHMRDTEGQAQPGAPNATADKEIDDRSVPEFGAVPPSNHNATSQQDAAAQHNLQARGGQAPQPNRTERSLLGFGSPVAPPQQQGVPQPLNTSGDIPPQGLPPQGAPVHPGLVNPPPPGAVPPHQPGLPPPHHPPQDPNRKPEENADQDINKRSVSPKFGGMMDRMMGYFA